MHSFLSLDVPAGDSNTSNKASSTNTENANTSGDDSNAPTSAGNTTTNSSEGAVKFVEAPLPKVNAWKVCLFFLFLLSHMRCIIYKHFLVIYRFDDKMNAEEEKTAAIAETKIHLSMNNL